MPEAYTDIEERIIKAIAAIQNRDKPNISKITREFNIPIGWLRSRLTGVQSKSAI